MDQPPSRRPRRKLIVLTILALFLLPVAARAALFAYAHGPMSWRDADWSSTGSLPPATTYKPARVLVMSGQTGSCVMYEYPRHGAGQCSTPAP